jgi:tryptophan synthase alpha subunit
MADGPAIQAASLRALKSGQKMRDTLEAHILLENLILLDYISYP